MELKRQVTTDRPRQAKKPRTIVLLQPTQPDDLEARLQEAFARKAEVTQLIQQKTEQIEDLAREHDEIHAEVEAQQRLIEQLYKERDNSYKENREKKSELFDEIGMTYKQAELCRMLVQQHDAKAKEEPDQYLREVYTDGAEFYRKLHWQYREKHREKIEEKRSIQEPSNDAIVDARNHLRELKSKRAEITEKKKEILVELNELKSESKRLYDKIGYLKAMQLPRYQTEVDEELLAELNIPEVWWPTARAVSNNGYVNVYFGDLDDALDWHGHIVVKEGEVVYRREPKSIPQVI